MLIWREFLWFFGSFENTFSPSFTLRQESWTSNEMMNRSNAFSGQKLPHACVLSAIRTLQCQQREEIEAHFWEKSTWTEFSPMCGFRKRVATTVHCPYRVELPSVVQRRFGCCISRRIARVYTAQLEIDAHLFEQSTWNRPIGNSVLELLACKAFANAQNWFQLKFSSISNIWQGSN